LAEQFFHSQELAKSHYKQTLHVASEQQQIIIDLRKENDELRAQLGPGATARAWEAKLGEETAKQASEAKPPGRYPSHMLDTNANDGPTLATDVDLMTGRQLISLPGEVDPVQRNLLSTGNTSPSPTIGGSNRLTTRTRFSSIVPQAKDGMGSTRVLAPGASLQGPEQQAECRTEELISRFSGGARVNEEVAHPLPGSKAVFADAASMKERVRQAILKPEYHVTNYYKQTGVWQKIARSTIFDNGTLVVIFLNAIWIAVDSDLNKAPVIFQADFIFQLVDYSFFVYFAFEWTVRFMAFARKRDCLRDTWFVFDSCLMALMIFDGWIMQVVIIMTGSTQSGMGAFPIIRILRLLRLTRMMRMARLLRAAPELMILIKGIAGATRSVGFTLLLLSGIIYIFAIAFRTLTDGSELGQRHFPTVPRAVSTLLLDGTLPDLAGIVYDVAAEHLLYGVLLVIFILLASLTVMNMLVGVLVEVVCTVSSVEKEQMEATFLKGHMLHLLRGLDEDGDVRISRDEFGKLLEKPKAIKALQEVGVDVVGLAELSDFIYKDRNELSFPDFMETVLQLRGTNTATVKSIVDMRMFMTKELARVEDTLLDKLHQVIQMDISQAMALSTRETQAVMSVREMQAVVSLHRGAISQSLAPPQTAAIGE